MKVSIITPSFNHGEFIERTIKSVLAQNYELEYVVMDGGSVDQTLDILNRYENQLSWKSEADNGQSHAINKGLQMTSGDVIGWLNSDDIYYPDTVKKVCQFFKDHPEVDVVYGDSCLIDRVDNKVGYYPTESWNLERLKVRCFLSQPSTFFRRRAVDKHGLLEESLQFCMDYEYWLRLGLRGVKFAYLPQMLAGARVYNETKSFRCCLEASLEANNLLKKELGYIPSERIVSYAGAKIKSSSGLSYPNPKFIMAVWMDLWATTGLYYEGSARVIAWLAAQQAMLKEFLRRAFDLLVKKFRY
ncbi:MAG: glycosyltransferase family 2 protein [Gammaproteobacteria bacterium]|nr:glycosyltransferase family 2 protein [Gammaproteobacteria bacterium]